MGDYVRVLSPSAKQIPVGELQRRLAKVHPTARLSLEEGSETVWDQLLLTHDDGLEIAVLERAPVEGEESLGYQEVAEFMEEAQSCEPMTGAAWLRSYLPTVRTIYSLQVLSGASRENGWDILGTVKTAIWHIGGGIFQADAEGFSNEDGYHIVQQFSDRAAGNWWMAVLKDGRWVSFEMDLGNPEHRAAFRESFPMARSWR